MIRRIAIAVPVVLVAWLAILAVVMRAGGDAPAAFVPFPPDRLISQLPDDISVTGASRISVTLKCEDPDLVARLYDAGAWLVLPAGLDACIPAILRKPARLRDAQ